MTDIDALNQRFAIAEVARFEAGGGGLMKIVVRSPLAAAEIYLHGAHVAHFQPAGQEPVLWMSRSSWFDETKPIRGGVPICFPWFGTHQEVPKGPAHGFARLRQWHVDSIKRSDGGEVVVTLLLHSDEQTRALWPAEFAARYIVTIGSALQMTLQVRNDSAVPIQFEEALHTYLNVGDIRQTTVQGLGGVKYLDKVAGGAAAEQTDPVIRFTGETDRVYSDTPATCVVNDPLLKRKIEIAKRSSKSTVVWNPWINKAKAMADFGDEEWPNMLCVETANVASDAVELAPGATHEMTAIVRIQD